MSTPNIEELVAQLSYYSGDGDQVDMARQAQRLAANALQSQAERIAELERESETHSKAYGLAIVERDNLRHELKTAQEGWRCECSTDDACRFARERDALRAQLAAISATEPVHYEFQWTNPGNLTGQPESMLVWARVEPRWNGTVQQKVDELRAYRYGGKPIYRVRALFTRPMPAQDVTLSLTDEQRTAIYESVKYEDNEGYWAVNCSDVIDATLAALSKYKGAK